jgi:hypothetical protein
MLKKQFFFGASFLISAALYASYQQDIGENSSRGFVRSISYGGHSANYGGNHSANYGDHSANYGGNHSADYGDHSANYGGHGVNHDHSAGY